MPEFKKKGGGAVKVKFLLLFINNIQDSLKDISKSKKKNRHFQNR